VFYNQDVLLEKGCFYNTIQNIAKLEFVSK